MARTATLAERLVVALAPALASAGGYSFDTYDLRPYRGSAQHTFAALDTHPLNATSLVHNIRNLSVRIISLHERSTAWYEANDFGFYDVIEELNNTADLRDENLDQLLANDVITRTCHLNMKDGQRRSFEMPSTAAIGCFLSHLRICQPDRPTLVLEEDAIIDDDALHRQLPLALEMMAANPAPMGNVFIFGPVQVFEGLMPWTNPTQPLGSQPDFQALGARGFFGTQGVLYSAEGCRMMNHLFGGPKEMQIDAAISHYSQTTLGDRPSDLASPVAQTLPQMNVWIETGESSITQRHDLGILGQSHVNNGCCFCYTPADQCFPLWLAVLLTILCTVVGWELLRLANRLAAQRYGVDPAGRVSSWCSTCCGKCCCSPCCRETAPAAAAPPASGKSKVDEASLLVKGKK